MVFVLFVEMRENLLSIFSDLVGRLIFFWKNFQGWLIKNLILLKPTNSSLSSAAVLGLKANFFSNTKQYFYFLVAIDITFGPVGRVKQILR